MLADRKDAFESFWATYPESRQRCLSQCRIAYDLAIHSLASELGGEDRAIAHLQKRLERYVNSPEAKKEKGKYVMAPKKWIDERHWEDSDASWGYVRPTYTGTPIAHQIAKAKQVPAEPKQNILEALHGAEVDAMSDDEALRVISPALRRMYAQRGKTGTIRDVLLKEISERARVKE